MCAINGFNFPDRELILKMKKFTSNRGPDAEGLYIDSNITIYHNRLSILDLNKNADQPMSYKNYIISFNGEIYNYRELRSSLIKLGYKFKTNSDTEVILHLFDKYNIEAFKKLSGIFAISIWDKFEKKLYLIRDTVGVKPLYYLKDNLTNKFFFSSSINSLLLNLKEKQINKSIFNYYSNLGRNDNNETIFKGIFKLMPGQLLILHNNSIEITNYLKFVFSYKEKNEDEIKQIISDTIKKQLVSDVPTSLALSGGVDSNIVYSVMRKNLDIKFNTYTFKFNDHEKFNEDFNIAKKNTEFYGNNFIPIEIGYKDFIENNEKISEILEEPIANQCSVLNYCMSKKISEKVLITGDGGDEIFTGYDRYRSIYIIQILQKFNIFKNFKIKSKFKNFNRLFLNSPKELFLSFSEQNIYKNHEKYFSNFKKAEVKDIGLNHTDKFDLKNNLNCVSLIDLDTLVPNDYLIRNDKIYMDSGIEVRVPLLDEDLINNLLMISSSKKFGYKFKSKHLMKKLFKNDIHSLVKKKWGMQSPVAKWMKGPLQNYIKEILSPGYYDSSKYFNFDNISKLITTHKEKYHNPELLWSLVMMQIYLKKYRL
jgi:asparagine synthase (glutamine-hydrolysing)